MKVVGPLSKDIYEIRFKRPGGWRWTRVKNVVGDSVLQPYKGGPFLPTLFVQCADKSRIEIPLTCLIWISPRREEILERKAAEAKAAIDAAAAADKAAEEQARQERDARRQKMRPRLIIPGGHSAPATAESAGPNEGDQAIIDGQPVIFSGGAWIRDLTVPKVPH